MIRIIEHGIRKKCTCDECECIFSYEEEDVYAGHRDCNNCEHNYTDYYEYHKRSSRISYCNAYKNYCNSCHNCSNWKKLDCLLSVVYCPECGCKVILEVL